ncbi:Hypothetical predicted protein [Mytilus galloprovincialis]|uniref:C1q domain-containing protein n=1 Tax=Mytilus galloprovincialis TaxID=29158 RepID=A0A8B6BG47_MYTGA|nr:Hypothetical predicted protein [Mytilus galloprovincialis]
MVSVNDYNEFPQDRYSDILLCHTVLVVIGTVIGVLGNSVTIVFYSCRIKERGERYFIPLLAIVDLIACLTISTKYGMNNTYLFDFPSNTVCCLLTFLQVFSSGLSAHILLIISIQRYLLVCKPFGPKMTLFWKRVSLSVACVFTLLYTCPLLGISGTKTSEDVFRNHTINTTSCSLSTACTKSTTMYFGLLALIILCNLVITTVLCIPVLKRIQTSFPNNSGTKSLDNKQEQNISSQEVLEISSKKTSGIEVLSVIKTTANSKLSGNSDTLNIVSNQELAYGSNRNKGPLTYALQKSSTTDNSSPEQEENEESLNESTQSKSSSANNKAERLLLNDPALIMERLTQLENTVQQQATTIQTQAQQIHQLQNEVNSSANMTPAFFAILTTSTSSIGNAEILKFNHVKTNTGGGYDVVTGVFIAPKAGTYHFTSVVYTYGNDDAVVQLNKNQDLLLKGYSVGTTHAESHTMNAIVALQKGDHIYIQHRGGSSDAVLGDSHSSFSGFFISE